MEIPGATRRFLFMRRRPITEQDRTIEQLPDRKGAKIVGTAKYPEYLYENAKKRINICKEAYDYMTSEMKPEGYMGKPWKKLNKDERLRYHLEELCKRDNAFRFTYSVMEDDICDSWRIPY